MLPSGTVAAPPLRLSRPWLIAAALAFAADLFLHLPVTDMFDALSARWGFRLYDRRVALSFAALAILAVLVVASRRQRWPLVLPATAGLVALAVLAHQLLLVASIENIHYPQYALLAFLLGRSRLSFEASWLDATALGAVDEAHQYLFLHRGRPEYLDWNDIVLNAIGAAFGIIALLLFSDARSGVSLCASRTAAAILLLVLAGALVLGPPITVPFFHPTNPGGRYHVLSPFEAFVLIGSLWFGVRSVLERNRACQRV
ncbi:MAG: hypothetical protein ACHQ9S_02810 [Candidatus Binatia bacterium]